MFADQKLPSTATGVKPARSFCRVLQGGPLPVVNGVISYNSPINGRKLMGNWSYFTLLIGVISPRAIDNWDPGPTLLDLDLS